MEEHPAAASFFGRLLLGHMRSLGLEASDEFATDGGIFRRHFGDEVLDEPRGAFLTGRGRRINGQAAP